MKDQERPRTELGLTMQASRLMEEHEKAMRTVLSELLHRSDYWKRRCIKAEGMLESNGIPFDFPDHM